MAAQLATVSDPETEDRLPPSYTIELDGVSEVDPRKWRTVVVDMVPINGRKQNVDVVYDLDAVTRSTTLAALREAPEWQVGVRLLLGEVGAWRLRDNKWALLEGVGVLETVNNRFEPDLSNPLRIAGVASWPGCGAGGTFASCVDPQQYVGLATDRALRPQEATRDPAVLIAGIDRAVAAWFVFEEALLGEITSGATSFVHRCGGDRYGRSSEECTGPGARPHEGPIVFRGPSAWSAEKGRYELEVLAVVDFVAGAALVEERAFVGYLLGRGGE